MAKAGAPPKDADQLATAGYSNLAQPEAAPPAETAVAVADAPKAAAEGSFTWANDRDKAMMSPDKFGPDGTSLHGDHDSPVWGISFTREHLAPPAAKVRAKDASNAWAKYRRLMGIITTEHEPTITQVKE